MSRTLALLVGIDDYPLLGPTSQLRGTLEDVDAMETLLRERAPRLGVRTLRNAQATRKGVIDAWLRIVDDARSGDEIFFYWSGHGSQVLDIHGDEDDGWDETLVPYDSGRGAHPNRDLLDDEVNYWLHLLSAKTERLCLIVDACHSGTVARAGVRFVPRDPRPRNLETGGQPVVPSWTPDGWFPKDGDWVLLSACRSDQLAQELPLGGTQRGVFSWALERAARRAAPGTRWHQLLEDARRDVSYATSRTQDPQIEGRGDRVSLLSPSDQ